jgi:lysophospholipase L1-like esterase
MPIRTVLCYGDSNTHGTMPVTQPGMLSRFDETDRWPGVLRGQLGADWRVIEEGLPGRTTVHDDPIEGRHKNGLTTLRPCLESHLPLDLVVLMLGTNDLKARFSVPAADIASSAEVLLKEIVACNAGPGGRAPDVLLVAPVPIEEVGFLGAMFEGGAAKSSQLAPLYAEVAERQGAAFFNAGTVARVSPVDGIHFEADQHHRLGGALAEAITRAGQARRGTA